MAGALTFVVIDFNHDTRFLLTKTLGRRFPQAVIREVDEAERAIAIVRAEPVSAIVTHRTFEVDGTDLVKRLRRENPTVPIVMVSGLDRESEAIAAGANHFVPYDEWLRVGTVVEQLLSARSPLTAEEPVG